MSGSQNELQTKDITDKKQTDKPKDPQANTEKKQSSKMISVKIQQLYRWQKASKEFSLQIKNLTNQNSNLKKKLEQIFVESNGIKKKYEQLVNENNLLKKRIEEKRKNDNVVQGLDQTIKQLHKIIDQTSLQLNKKSKQNQRIKEDLKLQRERNNEREKELQTLRNVSAQYFLLKQQVNRLEGQCTSLKKGRQSLKQLQLKLNKLTQKLIEEEQQTKIQKEKVLKLEDQINILLKQKNNSNKSIQTLEEQVERLKTINTECNEKIQMLEIQIKDLEKDKQIAIKKFLLQNKQLKELLLKEKKSKENLQQTIKNQLLQIQQKKSKEFEKYIGKNQKFLITKIQQLQLKNQIILETTNQASIQLAKIHNQLKQKNQSITILVNQLCKKWPNLEESEGLQYVQKQIIEIGKSQKHNYIQILQKVMIQNLRLKYSIQTIGSEYNQQLRKKL